MKVSYMYAVVALVIATVIWSLTFIIIKDTIHEIDPIAIAGYRFFLPTISIGLFVACVQKLSPFRYAIPRVVTGVLLWSFFIFQNIGLMYTTASNSSFLTGLSVIITPFLATILFKEKMTWFRVWTLIISVTGLWVLTGGIQGINYGGVLSILAVFGFAGSIVYSDRYVRSKHIPTLILSFQQFFWITILSFGWVLLSGRSFAVESSSAWLSLAYLSIMASLMGFTILNVVQKQLEPFIISLIQTNTTILGAIFAWTIGGEIATPEKILGATIMTCAILLPQLQKLIESPSTISVQLKKESKHS